MAARVAIVKNGLKGDLLSGIFAKVDGVLSPGHVTPIVWGSVNITHGAISDGRNLGVGELDNLGQGGFPTIIEGGHHGAANDHINQHVGV